MHHHRGHNHPDLDSGPIAGFQGWRALPAQRQSQGSTRAHRFVCRLAHKLRTAVHYPPEHQPVIGPLVIPSPAVAKALRCQNSVGQSRSSAASLCQAKGVRQRKNRCPLAKTTVLVWWPGAESNHRHADFQRTSPNCKPCTCKVLQRECKVVCDKRNVQTLLQSCNRQRKYFYYTCHHHTNRFF